MKKVKMLLIAFFLLACSNVAFATEKINEEEKSKIAQILNMSSVELKDIEKQLKDEGFLENGFLTVLVNEQNIVKNELKMDEFVEEMGIKIKFKNLTFNEFVTKVAEDILKNLKNRKIYICGWNIKTYFIKKEKDKLKCFKVAFTIKENILRIILNEITENLDITEFINKKNEIENKFKNYDIKKRLKDTNYLFENDLIKIVDENSLKITEMNLEEFKNKILNKFTEKKIPIFNGYYNYKINLLKNEKNNLNSKEFCIKYTPHCEPIFKVNENENENLKNKFLTKKNYENEEIKKLNFEPLKKYLEINNLFLNKKNEILWVENKYSNNFEDISYKKIKEYILKEICNKIKKNNYEIEEDITFVCDNSAKKEVFHILNLTYNPKKNQINILSSKICYTPYYTDKKNKNKKMFGIYNSFEKSKDIKNKKEKLRNFLNSQKFVKNNEITRTVAPNIIRKEELEDFLNYFFPPKNKKYTFELLNKKNDLYKIYYNEENKKIESEILKSKIKKNLEEYTDFITKNEETGKFEIKYNIEKNFKQIIENYLSDNNEAKEIIHIKNKYTLEKEMVEINNLVKEFKQKLEEEINNKQNFEKGNKKDHFEINFDGLYIKNSNSLFEEWEITPITLECFFVKDTNNNLNFNIFLKKEREKEKEKEKNKELIFKLQKEKIKDFLDEKLKDLKLLKNCNFEDLEFIKINTNTFKEEKNLSLDEFEDEFAGKILEKEIKNKENNEDQNYTNIQNFVLKNKKTNKIKLLNFEIKYEKKELLERYYGFKIRTIIEIKNKKFNRYFAENFFKNFIENMAKKLNEKEKEENNNFSFSKELFDEYLKKAGILNENEKIGIFNALGDEKINYFSLEEFKEIAKKAAEFFEHNRPIIKNVVKKDSKGNFCCVDLELIYNEDDKIIKIDNLEKNQNACLHLNEFLNKHNDNYLEEEALFYDDSLYFEILDKLKDAGFILNNSIEIYDAKKNKIKKYNKESFINLIREKIKEKMKELTFFEESKYNYERESLKIKIKNIVNKATGNCQNLELKFYIFPKFDEFSLNNIKKIEFYNYSFNQEDNKKYKENFDKLEIEKILNDEKMKMDEKVKNNEDFEKFENLINFYNKEINLKNEPLEKAIKLNMPTKEKLKELITNMPKIYIKNYGNEKTQQIEKEDFNYCDFVGNIIKKDTVKKQNSNKNENDIKNKINKELSNYVKTILEKNLKNMPTEGADEINFDFENSHFKKLKTYFKITKFPDPEPLKNCLKDFEFNLLKNAYILNIQFNQTLPFKTIDLIIPIKEKNKLEKIKKHFKENLNELNKKNEQIEKIEKITENTLENEKFKNFKVKIKNKYFTNENFDEIIKIEDKDLKIKNYNFDDFFQNKLRKKLEKSLKEKGKFEDEYEIKIKNITNDKNNEKFDLIFKIFKQNENKKIYYSLINPSTNNFDFKEINEKENKQLIFKNSYSFKSYYKDPIINPTIDLIYYDGNNFKTSHVGVNPKNNNNKEKLIFYEEEKSKINNFLNIDFPIYKNLEEKAQKEIIKNLLEQINMFFDDYLKNDFSFGTSQKHQTAKTVKIENNATQQKIKITFISEKIKDLEYLNKAIKFNHNFLDEVFIITPYLNINLKENIKLFPRLILPKIFLRKKFEEFDGGEKNFKSLSESFKNIIVFKSEEKLMEKIKELKLKPNGFCYNYEKNLENEIEEYNKKIKPLKEEREEKIKETEAKIKKREEKIKETEAKIKETTEKIEEITGKIEERKAKIENLKKNLKNLEQSPDFITQKRNNFYEKKKNEEKKEKTELENKKIKLEEEMEKTELEKNYLEQEKDNYDFSLKYFKETEETELEEINLNKKTLKYLINLEKTKEETELKKNKETLENFKKNCKPKTLEISFTDPYYPDIVFVKADVYYYNDFIRIENFSYAIKETEEHKLKQKRERKIKTYNLNFFKEKDKNKLKDLKIAENEADVELIKNEIADKLEEEDLIKLKKITLAGKTPYVIPLKLEIEYNSENGNKTFKWFKLEIYYSVSLKGFKVKNIKTITKEEFEEFKKNEKEEK